MKKLLMAMLGLTILTGCTSEPAKQVQTEKPKPKTTEAVTGAPPFKSFISLPAVGLAMPNLIGWNHRSLPTGRAKMESRRCGVPTSRRRANAA